MDRGAAWTATETESLVLFKNADVHCCEWEGKGSKIGWESCQSHRLTTRTTGRSWGYSQAVRSHCRVLGTEVG